MIHSQRTKNIISEGVKAAAARRRDIILQELRPLLIMGMTISKACERVGISTQTYYNWLEKVPNLIEEIRQIRLDPLVKSHRTWILAIEHGNVQMAWEYMKLKEPDEFKILPSKVELSGNVSSDFGDTNPKMADAIAVAVTDELSRRNIEANKDDGK